MFCDHCGKNIPDDAVLCPYCGISTGENQHAVLYLTDDVQQADAVGSSSDTVRDDFSHFGGPSPYPSYSSQSSYQQGYRSVPRAPRVPHVPSIAHPVQQPGYDSQAMNYQAYPRQPLQPPQSPQFIPVVPVSPVVVGQAHMKSDNATVLEVVLSLFGIFGLGWLLGGETTIGIILLICSFAIYLPLLFLGTIFTFGAGLLCLGPLAIVAIIINGVLCNATLKRREARLFFVQQPPIVHAPPPMQQ